MVTNVLPHYREGFYRALFRRPDLDVHVYCQPSIPGMNLSMIHDRFADRVFLLHFLSTKREMLGWQFLPWRKLLSSYDVLFVQGNPRVPSNVVLSILARWSKRPVVLWGQAHTAGASGVTESLRLWWWRNFDHVMVYNDGETSWLKSRGFERQFVLGMNNGLDQRAIDEAASLWNEERLAAWRQDHALANRTLVLSCARLEPKNRFDLWIAAMPEAIRRCPNLLWCVIGDGQERRALEELAGRSGLGEHIRWLGPIEREAELAPWFLGSRVLVHPAGIGLTLLHAFGYGLPVVTHDDAKTQMPEFAAFIPEETGLAYRPGDPESLAEAVTRCLADEPERRRMGERGRRIAREEYNVDVMAARFACMAKRARAGR